MAQKPSLNVQKTFKEYFVEKTFDRPETRITREEYNELKWLNTVPEIVCDILCYLVNYFHYRTDKISRDAYVSMLTGQIMNMPILSKDQIVNIDQGGWMNSTDGIKHRIDHL